MQARMKNPGVVIPDVMTAIRSLNKAIKQGGVPPRTLDLVHLRASQINGCSVCVGAAAKAKKDGETDVPSLLIQCCRCNRNLFWFACAHINANDADGKCKQQLNIAEGERFEMPVSPRLPVVATPTSQAMKTFRRCQSRYLRAGAWAPSGRSSTSRSGGCP